MFYDLIKSNRNKLLLIFFSYPVYILVNNLAIVISLTITDWPYHFYFNGFACTLEEVEEFRDYSTEVFWLYFISKLGLLFILFFFNLKYFRFQFPFYIAILSIDILGVFSYVFDKLSFGISLFKYHLSNIYLYYLSQSFKISRYLIPVLFIVSSVLVIKLVGLKNEKGQTYRSCFTLSLVSLSLYILAFELYLEILDWYWS